MPFPNTISTSAAQASAKLANIALNATQTNAVPLDRLTFIEETLGNLLASASLPASKFTSNAGSGATTAAAGDMTGAYFVAATYTAVGAANLTTRTAVQLFADVLNAAVGDSFMLLIRNSSGGTTTLVGGTGVTVTGTATMATLTGRLFNVRFVSATAVTFQDMGSTAA